MLQPRSLHRPGPAHPAQQNTSRMHSPCSSCWGKGRVLLHPSAARLHLRELQCFHFLGLFQASCHSCSLDTLALFYAAFSPLSYNIPLSCALQPGQGRSSPRSRDGRGWGSLSTPLVIALSYHPSSFAFVAQPQCNCSNHIFGETIINLLPPSQRAGAAHGRCKYFTPCTQVGAHSSDFSKKNHSGHFMDISIQRPSRIWSHCEAHARKIHILIKL